MKQTTIKQAAARALTVHARALYRMSNGQTPFTAHDGATAGQIRGCHKVADTLCRWGAMEGGCITEKGLAILARYREINPYWNPVY